MAIFNLQRKKKIVLVGGAEVVLSEPSAYERMQYGEKLSSVDYKTAKPIELMRCEVSARVDLIAACMRYSLPDSTIDEIKQEIESLPPENLNDLSKAALQLSGQNMDGDDGESEKK